jgi:hypothetical protein
MLEFIKQMFSGVADTSIKRVLAYQCFMFYFFIYIMTFFKEMTENQLAMSDKILYFGGALILGTMAEKFKFKSKT